jgi:hypothetical protein
MKYIIIILLVLIILLFYSKQNIEYRYENLEQCDQNCGKFKTEEDCLNCKYCGVCKLVSRGKLYTYCYPGDKDGAYFNESCKGDAWTFKGDTQKTTPTEKNIITLDRTPRDYTVQPTTKEDILKALNEITEKTEETPKQEQVEIKEKEIKPELKSYQDILAELENLLNSFYK